MTQGDKEACIMHNMDILSDIIPYSSPNYNSELRKLAELCYDNKNDSELDGLCKWHDKMLDEGLIDF